MTKKIVLALTLFALASTAYADSVAIMSRVSGDVKINQGVEFVQAQAGQPVDAGDRILAMEGAEATVTYSDGCELHVAGGSLVTVPATSTCKGAALTTQHIVPSDAGPIGGAAGTYDTVNTVGWVWIGTAAACFLFCESEDNNNTASP